MYFISTLVKPSYNSIYQCFYNKDFRQIALMGGIISGELCDKICNRRRDGRKDRC